MPSVPGLEQAHAVTTAVCTDVEVSVKIEK